MKTGFKRTAAFLLAVVTVFCGCSLSVFATEADKEFEYVLEKEYSLATAPAAVSVLSGSEEIDWDAVKTKIKSGLLNCDEAVDIYEFSIPATQEYANFISDILNYEMPEAYHYSGGSFTIKGELLSRVKLKYSMTKDEYLRANEVFLKNSQMLLKGIEGNDTLTDAEKALLLHDRIAVWNDYDYKDFVNDTIPPAAYTAYGAIVERSSVCMGYAFAYMYLLDRVGVESEYCSSRTLGHGWNIVYIDGEAYHVDITWDDNGYIEGDVKYNNFLISSERLYEVGHTADDYKTFPQSTKYEDYFWNNSNTAFQIIGDTIYYIDNKSQTINTYIDGVTCEIYDISAEWPAGPHSMWQGHYSRLSSDGKNLLYSTPYSVYALNPVTMEKDRLFTPKSASGLYCIYGFNYAEGYLVCDLADTPNNVDFGYTEYKRYTVEESDYDVECVHAFDSFYTVDVAPTETESGVRSIHCRNCEHRKDEREMLPYGQVEAGDFDGDGKVNAKDVFFARQAALSFSDNSDWLYLEQADTNGDGVINIKDVIITRRMMFASVEK